MPFANMLGKDAQSNCVLEAMTCEDDLAALIQGVGVVVTQSIEFERYHGAVAAESAKDVLNTCVNNLKIMGISGLHVELELTDNPGVYCARRE